MDNLEKQPQDITNITDHENIDLTKDIDVDGDYVINWDQKEETDAVQEQGAEGVSLGEQAGDSEEVDEGLRIESDQGEDADEGEGQEEEYVEDISVQLGEIQRDEAEPVEEEGDIDQEESYEEEDQNDIPERWSGLLDFIDDNPGATPADYVKLTEGFDKLSDEQAIKMKLASDEGLDPDEDAEEVNFLYKDKFGYDEELDSERDVTLRRIASKKALKEARSHLGEMKEKYSSDLTFKNESPENQGAVKFQQEQLELQEENKELALDFQNKTKSFFNDGFKGFEFEYGDGKSQRIKVGDIDKAAESQSDIGNFIGQFINDDGEISDMKGYHKSLWAAQNADALFSHAYEQGKADAVRSSAKSAKNIDMGPRKSDGEVTQQGQFKLEDEGSHTEDFRFNF